MLIRQISTCAAGSVIALALAFGSAQAADEQNTQTQPQAQQSAQLKGHDREFFNKAAQGGLMEVEAAKLAKDRASSADVKSLAETLERDHSAGNQKLMQIAQEKGLEAPKLDSKHQKELDKLSKLKGEEFDKAFLQRVGMKDHKEDIKLFEREAKDGNDAQLKAFAQEQLPTLRNHLAMIEKMHGGHTAKSESHKAGSTASSQENPTDHKQQ